MKILIRTISLFLSLVLIYLLYVLLSYKRLPDKLELEVLSPAAGSADYNEVKINTEYTALTYNIGFGAYTPDFSFFMDGGKSSWAKSKASVVSAVVGAAEFIKNQKPDFSLIQEVDIDGTRSYHVDEFDLFSMQLADYYKVFAQNYDSAFLMYPPAQPHGKNKSGIALFSLYKIESSIRKSLS